MGSTGVGKSTWINSIVNYLTFPTLEQARKQQKVLSVVGTSFVVTDHNYEIREIKIHDDNENDSPGQSATQTSRAYVIEHGNRRIRLIDTPGIGDTRGIDADNQNFENILKVSGGILISWMAYAFY